MAGWSGRGAAAGVTERGKGESGSGEMLDGTDKMIGG